MPPDEGPDPNDGTPNAQRTELFHTSEAGNSSAVILAAIVGATTDPDERWKAIKLLRVLRLNEPNAVAERNDLTSFPAAFYGAYRDGRLSGVAAEMNIQPIIDDPVHLDIDWFGPPGLNWWGGGFDGRTWEFEVAAALVNYLEWSMDVIRSRADPATWRWHDPTTEDPFEDLLAKQRDTNRPVKNLVIEWIAERNRKSFRAREEDGKLQISTNIPPRRPPLTLREEE